jgi:DNA polymerase (family 10)
VDNAQVAHLFAELADLLEIAGENPFKTRAYRAFAQTAREHAEPLAVIAARGELEALPGVGKAIAAKVDAAVHTGSFPALDRARGQVPESVQRLLEVPGLGARIVRTLWKDAGVQSLGELAYACEENKLAHLPGIGAERQARVLEAVRALLEKGDGVLLATAVMATRGLESLLRAAGAAEVRAVGEARRGVEIVRELLVLVRGLSADGVVVAAIDAKPELEGVRAQPAADGATLVTHGLPVRVRVVPEAQWVHALIAGTGDAAHVAWLEALAREGAPERQGAELAAICARAANEDAVYAALGLAFVPPELREGPAPRIPDGLVAPEDIHGFFHVHTDWSDGTASVLSMVRAASRAGYDYVGISDHSRAAAYANGLDPARLAEQAKAIAMARREAKGCAILHGIEVDILADGTLDLPDDVLAKLDFVIASVHSRLAMPEEEMTARIVRAVSHPLVTILGHPTGRLLLARRGYAFDLEAVARAAAANDTYLEINANAQRLDLSDVLVKRAASVGARFAIDPDAHAEHAVDETLLGVMVARRAGLTRDQVLNARESEPLARALAARKKRAIARLGTGRGER